MDYTVREARVNDAEAFVPLLASLGYPNGVVSLRARIANIIQNPDAELLVAVTVQSNQVVGLLSLSYIPQLGIEGDVSRIGFFVVDTSLQRAGIGKLLETHADNLSRERGCNRMVLLSVFADYQEVHCHERRTAAHAFYQKQGYCESPKYFVKLFGEKPEAERAWERSDT